MFIIKAYKETIDWEALGIEQNTPVWAKPKAIVQNRNCLMIRDIEMPQGSGLDLLAWVGQKMTFKRSSSPNCADLLAKAGELQSLNTSTDWPRRIYHSKTKIKRHKSALN